MYLEARRVRLAPAHVWYRPVLPALQWLRRHPLWGYFLLAFGLEWVWQVPMYLATHQQLLGPWVLLSPTAAGFAMALVTDGRAGMLRLLRRCLVWRAAPRWYAVVFLSMPALLFLGLLVQPGAVAALQLPSASFLWGYPLALVFGASGLLAAGVGEEPGWRGFALPRLQARFGPLRGSLLLGALWGVWHLPLWLFIPGHAGARPGLVGTAVPFLGWFAFIVAFSVLITWVTNHAGGSVLLAMAFHASHNATYDTFARTFFPALYPPEVAAIAPLSVGAEVGVVLVTVVVALLTRGSLGYVGYLGYRGDGCSLRNAVPARTPAGGVAGRRQPQRALVAQEVTQ